MPSYTLRHSRRTRAYIAMRWAAQLAYVKLIREYATLVLNRDEVVRMDMVIAEMAMLLEEIENPPRTPRHAGHHDPIKEQGDD